ncbi:hypothetical protein OY671_007828, partial [Metschnikowia pulcherrima]
ESSERSSQEANSFASRIDVAEESSRSRSHVAESRHSSTDGGGKPEGKKNAGSAGKRSDFSFQEMNREANTSGSKAGSMEVTRAAMDSKSSIEQMREQAQNIE